LTKIHRAEFTTVNLDDFFVCFLDLQNPVRELPFQVSRIPVKARLRVNQMIGFQKGRRNLDFGQIFKGDPPGDEK
jgi:hypothetical protein